MADKPNTPELDKMLAHVNTPATESVTQILGDFLEWIFDGEHTITVDMGSGESITHRIGYALAKVDQDDPEDEWTAWRPDFNALLADYLGVNLSKVEEERTAVLKWTRKEQGLE